MKTYIKQFMDKYYVVASIDYIHDGHELHADDDDLIILGVFFDVLTIAKAVFYTNESHATEYFAERFIDFAKQYHCKVITSSDFNEYSFPVFRSKKNAERFKTAIDTLLVLKNS
jgi:hypothetical protein